MTEIVKNFLSEKSHRSLLQRSQAIVSRRKTERFRLRGLFADLGQVHQHVRRFGRAEEHEIICQERLRHVQKGGPIPQGYG